MFSPNASIIEANDWLSHVDYQVLQNRYQIFSSRYGAQKTTWTNHRCKTNENGVQIIILNFMIDVSWLNFQNLCRFVIFFFFGDVPNVKIERQAFGRIRRLRQKWWVRMIRFLVEDSVSLRTNAMLFVKSLPELMTELDAEVFFESNTETIIRVFTKSRALPVTLLIFTCGHCYSYFRRLRTMKTLQVIPADTHGRFDRGKFRKKPEKRGQNYI